MALITGTDPLLTDLDYANLTIAEQTKVDAILEVGTELIEKYCGRVFTATSYTEQTDGTDHNEIYVKHPPIRTLTSVVIRYGPVAEADETYTTNYFETDDNTGRITFSEFNITSSDALAIPSYFPIGFRNIIISYDGGYAAIPEPIQLVLADFTMKAKDGVGSSEIVAEKLGQYFYKTKDAVTSPKQDTDYSGMTKYYQILDLYRIRRP